MCIIALIRPLLRQSLRLLLNLVLRRPWLGLRLVRWLILRQRGKTRLLAAWIGHYTAKEIAWTVTDLGRWRSCVRASMARKSTDAEVRRRPPPSLYFVA